MKIIAFLLLSLITTRAFAQTNSLEFFITDSTNSINKDLIPYQPNLSFFVEKIGKPDRIKKEKNTIRNIYDNLGISIVSENFTGQVKSIGFYYTSILKEYPKNQFQGKIYVNGIQLLRDDPAEAIQQKLPAFKYENILGLCLYENHKTDFYISTFPGNSQWKSFGFNFFRQKND